MNPILVIGATGTVGRQVVSRLAATARSPRDGGNPGAARLPPQVEVVRGDLTLPETLLDAFRWQIDTGCSGCQSEPALWLEADHTRNIVSIRLIATLSSSVSGRVRFREPPRLCAIEPRLGCRPSPDLRAVGPIERQPAADGAGRSNNEYRIHAEPS